MKRTLSVKSFWGLFSPEKETTFKMQYMSCLALLFTLLAISEKCINTTSTKEHKNV